MDEGISAKVPARNGSAIVTKAEFLYGVVEVTADVPAGSGKSTKTVKGVLAGYAIAEGENVVVHGIEKFLPSSVVAETNLDALHARTCEIGQRLAAELGVGVAARIGLRSGGREDACTISAVRNFGDASDSEIFIELPAAQSLLGQPGRVAVIQAVVPGDSRSVDEYIASVERENLSIQIRAVHQFSEAQGKIYSKISGLLTATVVLVLILTALCVLAAMTNVAMERRNDVGLMKAIGGATRRVARLFLTEAAVLGLVGGLVGAALGILLSMELGKAVFGVAARPRLIVYPIAVGLTVLVAIVSAYPLRRLASVRPASVFRGEA
jgi:putative ABC transport system permease protein